MKIVIAGAGEVGFHLAKLLSYESQDITLIEPSKENINYANTHLDILTIQGDATSPQILKEADIGGADLVVCVTESEASNILISILSKKMGCKRTVARVSNSEYIENKLNIDFSSLGVDELISPEHLASQEIQLLLRSAFSDTFEFDDGALVTVGSVINRNAAFVGKSVMEAVKTFPQLKFVTIAIQRKGTLYTVIPRGDTLFEEEDLVYFVIPKESEKLLRELAGMKNSPVKSAMILGGSKIGFKTAQELSKKNIFVKLIEQDGKKAQALAEKLPNALVIKGNGCNVNLLEDEDLESMDAFISVTGNSETNIISCLLARDRGIKKTIALVENTDYFNLSHTIGIDSLINKKLLAASSIFRHVRKGEVVAITKLNNMDAELLEFVVKKNSSIANKKIKDLDFPRSAIIGGVIRKGKGIIASGEFKVEYQDRVVICCLPEAISKVEKLFNE